MTFSPFMLSYQSFEWIEIHAETFLVRVLPSNALTSISISFLYVPSVIWLTVYT